MNQVVIRNEDGTLQHYGVRGMKWDEKKLKRKTEKLEKLVSKTVQRHDKKRFWQKEVTDEEIDKIAKDIRSEKAKVDKKIQKAQKFLDKAKEADAKKIINRYNKDKYKRQVVTDYLGSLKMNSTSLSELRTQMMDVRLD